MAVTHELITMTREVRSLHERLGTLQETVESGKGSEEQKERLELLRLEGQACFSMVKLPEKPV